MPTAFTPLSALAGGALIGAAVLVLFVATGRIAGVSGIVGASLRGGVSLAERAWRAAFLLGLVAGPLLAMAVLRRPLIERSPASGALLIVAGLAVGLGTGLSNGCTSGHGVCGVSRLSRRSLAATAIFMAVGVLTASVLRHLLPE
jgi:uncharacterized membrane protein YedE/YeeE